MIESREWDRLMRGSSHFSVDRVTKASIEATGRDDLVAFHRSHIHPRNFVIAVSGDVAADEILAKLEAHLADWKSPEGQAPEIPKPAHEPVAGVYLGGNPKV